MAKKFTEVQLSRILGECDADHLKVGGCSSDTFAKGEDTKCCINQAAYLEPSCGNALSLNTEPASWFDANYERMVRNPDALLAGLEEIGAV